MEIKLGCSGICRVGYSAVSRAEGHNDQEPVCQEHCDDNNVEYQVKAPKYGNQRGLGAGYLTPRKHVIVYRCILQNDKMAKCVLYLNKN